MIIRIFISFLIKLFYDLPLMLLGLVFVAIGLKYEKDNHLPKLLWLWDNAKYGCNGGNFWLRENGENTSFWAKYQWLALRNPTYNSSQFVLGYISSGIYTIEGNKDVTRSGVAGYYWAREGWHWEYHLIKPFTVLGLSLCFKFRAGWKLANKVAGERVSFVFTVWIYKFNKVNHG